MDILEKIFGSAAKVKIMRLFLFNPNKPYDLEQVSNRARISPQAARHEIKTLAGIQLLKQKDPNYKGGNGSKNGKGKNGAGKKNGGKGGKNGKNGGKNGKNGKAEDFERGKIKKIEIVKKRVQGWTLDDNFPYLEALQSFLIHVSPLQDQIIARKFNRLGKVKLLIVAGVFIQEKDSRVDVLIVGDNLRRGAIDTTIKEIEAELGRDLTYSVFETKDFQYRLGIYDKLIRDIIDYPHKKLINKLDL
jgi:hypothetical protein